MADVDSDHEEQTVANDLVVTKYKMAAGIVNSCMEMIVEMCVPGKTILDICQAGDAYLLEETSKVCKSKKSMKKGIAFPTCISVNNCICHFSPLVSDPEVTIKDGDLVKIDLGAHVDGFPAVAGHTFVVGASADNNVSGRKADVVLAAHYASEAALRLVKPGAENWPVTDAVQKVAESYECKPIEGMLSHQLKQNIIDGEKTIIQNPSEAQRKEQTKHEFDMHEVYGIDVLVSTGEGRGREMETRTTVYKRKDMIYNLKSKYSRQLFSEVENKFQTMPFALRLLESETKAKMGVVECVKHGLLDQFQVLYERENELVAQFKFTVLLMPNGPLKITGLNVETDLYTSDKSVKDEELKTLLATSVSRKALKKKRKKTSQHAGAGAAEAATEQ